MEFWRYYRVLRQKRWLILVAAVAAIAVAIATNRPSTGDYSATATLSVPSAQRFLFVTGVSSGPEQIGPDARTALAMSLIQSWEVAQRVVQSLNLTMRPDELQRRITVEKDRLSDLLRVTVTGKTPLEAVTLANAVAQTAAAYDQELQRREVTLGREFLEKQADQVQNQLRAAEDSLLAFQQKNGAVLASSQSAQVGNLEAELQHADLGLRGIDARLSTVTAQLSQQSSTRSDQQIFYNPVAQELRGQLVRLEVALTSELAVYTEKHPTVVALKSMIQAVKDRLSQELNRTVFAEQVQHNPIYDALTQERINLETEKVALQAEKEALQQAVSDAKGAIPDLAQRQLEQSRLTRSVEILSGEYAKLEGQLGDTRLREQEAQNLGSLSLVDNARTAFPSPYSGLRFKLTLASVLGLLGGVGLAFFQEYLDTTLKTPENAERVLGMPVLVAVPRHNPPFDEAYRLLRVHLMAHESAEGGDAIVVSSPKPQGGTSTVVANLARAFAQAGRHTIVVDAALPRAVQHVRFGVANEKGLADVLKGEATLPDVLVQTDVPNLWVLPSGTVPKETGGLLSSKAMDGLLADLKRIGDVILIDTPPAGVFADVLSVARRASGVLLVLDARHASRGAPDQLKAHLDRLGVKVIGVVLTKVRPDLVDSYVYQERFYKAPSHPRLSVAAGAIGALVLILLAGSLFVLSRGPEYAGLSGGLPSVVAQAVAHLISSLPQI
jgi:polysaccharide biosynthesis transport protein